MKNIVLFDDEVWSELLPLTFTRPLGLLRVGILTIAEKWQKALAIDSLCFWTQPYLSPKFPMNLGEQNYFINGRILPNTALVEEILALKEGECLVKDEMVVAFVQADLHGSSNIKGVVSSTHKETKSSFVQLNHVWDLFQLNGAAIQADFEVLTKGRQSQSLHKSNVVIGDESLVFLEEGSTIFAATLNTNHGPIYIGKNAEVMEGANLRGSFALCTHGVVKMAAKIYKGTTIGPYAKVGGELSNVMIQGYSNKGHDGYLGNAVIGEWCNLGADTNCSNLKNNYGEIKVWNYTAEAFVQSGLQFCGLIMGDHAKSGINTMFNTGTVIGVAANIFGAGFPNKHIPSFSWGTSQTYDMQKMFETAERVMARRKQILTEIDKEILQYLFHNTKVYRSWENGF